MILVKVDINNASKLAELIAQNRDTFECLGYAETGTQYTGTVAGFKQCYKAGDKEFATVGELTADYLAWLGSVLQTRIDKHCAALTAERIRRDDDPDSTSDAHGTTWQTGPDDLKKLNNALTTYTALGDVPAGFKWWDIHNVAHDADLTFLAQIAAADAQRQFSNFIQCVTLKQQARALTAAPGVLYQLANFHWLQE